MRFRSDKVAMTADVQQMFHCFRVRKDHGNYLRSMWYRDNDPSNEMVDYRMNVHVFGNRPSPAVAPYGLKKIAALSSEEFGRDVASFVTSNFYVDDGLALTDTSEEAMDLMTRTQNALKVNGNLRLHKIASNSVSVMKTFPKDDLAKGLKEGKINQGSLPVQQGLGLY